MAAGFTGVEELQIERQESALLAGAVADVASHYNMVVDPKVLAWAGLLGVCGSIYGPRVAAVKLRKTMEREQAKADKAQAQFSHPGGNVAAFG